MYSYFIYDEENSDYWQFFCKQNFSLLSVLLTKHLQSPFFFLFLHLKPALHPCWFASILLLIHCLCWHTAVSWCITANCRSVGLCETIAKNVCHVTHVRMHVYPCLRTRYKQIQGLK